MPTPRRNSAPTSAFARSWAGCWTQKCSTILPAKMPKTTFHPRQRNSLLTHFLATMSEDLDIQVDHSRRYPHPSFRAPEAAPGGARFTSDPGEASRWRQAITQVFARAGVLIAAVESDWHFGETLYAPSLEAISDSEAACFVIGRTVRESGLIVESRMLLREHDLRVESPARVIRFQRREEAAHLLVGQLRCRASGDSYEPMPPPGIAHAARRRISYSILALRNN